MKKKPMKQAFRGGTYALMMTAMVLTVLILLNVTMGLLPSSMTRFDISAAKLYSVTSNTKNVVQNLQQDVTIYWISQPDQEDEILRNLLSRYEALSDHLHVVKRNPDVYPAFAENYTDEPVQNNSLVVESGEVSRYIPVTDIYLAQPDPGTYSYTASFDGEGAITSAIDYCVTTEHPVVYQLEGHGELPLPEFFLDQLKKSNMDVKSLSLLNLETMPEDCAVLMIHGPASDISPEEAEILIDYAENGGRLLTLAGPTPEGILPNLCSILSHFGITTQEGVIVEEDRAHYTFRTPYILLPRVENADITEPLLAEHYYPIVPIAQGLNLDPADPTVIPLLTTSPASFNQPEGYQMQDYEKNPGDLEGSFTVGAAIQAGQEGKIIWYSSSLMLDPLYNAYSSGANVDLLMNSLTDMIGENESLSIRSKPLGYQYLTISDSTAAMLKTLLIGVFPLGYLGIGIAVVLRKRKEQSNEALS